MKNAIRAAAAALLIALASAGAGAQTVLYPIPEPQTEPKLAADYPVFVNRMIAQGDFEKALEYAEAGIEKNPKNISLAFKRGVILEQLGRKDEARAVYEQLIRLYPEVPEPYNNLAILVADNGRGDLDHAIELLQRAITANPRFATAQENLGDIYALKALQSYRASAAAAPRKADRSRITEKITMLQITTGNNPAPEAAEDSAAKATQAAKATAPAASVTQTAPASAQPRAEAPEAQAPAKSARAKKAAKSVKKPAAKNAKTLGNAVVTKSRGITETAEPIEKPAAAAPAPAATAPAPHAAGGVSASDYQARRSENTLFRPLPEINP